MVDLTKCSSELLDKARADERGRSADLVAQDGPLRQTIIALTDGSRMAEHNSPPAGSLQVLEGKVRVELGDEMQGELSAGELMILTHERHSVLALADSVFLLTTVTNVDQPSHS
jgi:quercetin dioxygenase-like cupin family protein